MHWIIIGIIVIIFIIGGIVSLFEAIGEFFSGISNDISENKRKSRAIKVEQEKGRNDLIQRFGKRNLSLPLWERNLDIIGYYLSQVTHSTSLASVNSIIRNCISDIYTIDKYSDSEYNILAKFIENKFNEKITTAKKDKTEEDIAYATLTTVENIYIDAERLLKKVSQKMDQLGIAIPNISIGKDLLYHLNKKSYKNIDSLLDDLLFYNENKFTEKKKENLFIGDVIENVLKKASDNNIKRQIDKSKLENINDIISKKDIVSLNSALNISTNKVPSKYGSLKKIQTKIAEKIDLINITINERLPWMKSHLNKLINDYNKQIENMVNGCKDGNKKAIEGENEILLTDANYDNMFKKEFELAYIEDSKLLLVEYIFPDLDHFPTLKEIKVSVKGIEKEIHYSSSALAGLYDNYINSVCLRIIYEICKHDIYNNIDAVSFNGWVNTINKGTGKDENICLVSIQIKKSDILEVDLKKIDPKIAFRNFRGISAAKLSSLTPIKPIMTINKKDRRFVEGYDVMDKMDNTTNLASMDWQDFENLIRELFGKIYSKDGGEVKVTQASRDGGIDAVAFDPDPIKGGKIVIQAKRYTNVVGVSAVRDLYGTVHNEGAMKGILVTTSNFGSDAYQFAKDKPLTLLSGNELLYLLQENGYAAHINIREAKKELKAMEEEKQNRIY